MRIVNLLSNSAYGYIRAIITLIVGVLIVAWPGTAVKTLVMIMGAFLIASGTVSLIVSYKARNSEDKSALMFFNSLIIIVFGLILIIFPDFFVSIIMFLFGAILILFGLIQIVNLVRVRKMVKLPWTFYITPVLVTLCGVIIFFNPFRTLSAIFIFFGIVLIIYAISEFISTISLRKALKEMNELNGRGEIVDGDFEEL